MRFSRFVLTALLAIPIVALAQQNAQPQQDSLTGNDTALGITYSAAQNGDVVTVNLNLNNKDIAAQIDYAHQAVKVQSVSSDTHQIGSLTKPDIDTLNSLLRRIQPANSRVNDALLSTLNFLANFDAGAPVDIDTTASKSGQASPSATITSICSSIGSAIPGTYTVNGHTIVQAAICGPCGSGDCVGRCGQGCGAPPSPSMQRFTQECLNHDLCAARTGQNQGPCGDEFLAATPGFFFAHDCASMAGSWVDGYSYIWSLAEDAGTIGGFVEVVGCGNWKVSGSRSGFNITLTATNTHPNNGCCTAFTYTGSEQCNSASGSWTNQCGSAGDWSMTRQDANDTGTVPRTPSVGPAPGQRN